MIKIASLLISAVIAVSVTDASYTETNERYTGITSSEYGNIMLIDELDLLDESEEKNIYITIFEAVKAKDISVGIVSAADVSDETAEWYYNQISESDPDFALMLFNETDYSYHFYGSAETEFKNDTDAFWMTDDFISQQHYFIAGVQFPLDIQYHTVSEIISEETTQTEISEAVPEIFPENYFTEIANDGIHTAKMENGHVALLHDLDDSLSTDEEAEILTDLMGAVRDKDFSIGIVITDDIGADKSDYGVMDFTDVYYEKYCGKNTDGILLLINNDNKYDWISTSGSCIDMFYDAVDLIFDALYDYLVDGNYNYACQRFVQEVKYYSEQSYVHYDDDYDYYFDSEEAEGIFSMLAVGFFVAVIAVLIFVSIVNSNYKMRKNVTAANYKLENSLVFSQQTDTYIRTYTTRRTVSSSSSGGRSGSRSSGRSHRSSGGGRHGGGGRRR